MGVKVPDFTSHMPMLQSFRTFSLLRPIVERHEETSARLTKLVRASAAPHHPIHLTVTSQTERDITLTFNLMNNHIYSTLFKIQERKSDRRSREIEQRKESQNTHTHKTKTCELNLLH